MKFHYLARGIIRHSGKILLAHQKGASNTFLPGGHIGTDEGAEAALVREIQEEMGKAAIVEGFVGAVEHRWMEQAEENTEINLIFELTVPGLDTSAAPQALEQHLEFEWAEQNELQQRNLQPHPLQRCLLRRDYRPLWASTISDTDPK